MIKFQFVGAIILSSISFVYGVGVGAYKLFPFHYLYSVKKMLEPQTQAPKTDFREARVALFEEFVTTPDVVFIGDSLTQNGEWAEFIPHLRVANRGIGSDKTDDVLARLDSITSLNAGSIFIMLGINDVYAGIPISHIAQNYRLIILALQERDVDIVIQSTIQCEPSICGLRTVAKINELNYELKKLADELNVSFLQLSDLSGVDGLPSLFTYDGVHLTAVGYRNWVESVDMMLKTHNRFKDINLRAF